MTFIKKKIKIEYILKYWSYLWFLRINGILIFCQNLSLNAFKDLSMQRSLKDLGYQWKFLNRYIVKELMDKKLLIKIKNFRTVLIIDNISNLKKVENFLKKNDILILGFYFQNIFFFKEDLNIKNIEKIHIFNNIKKRLLKYILIVQILINCLKKIIMKLFFVLNKKNLN